MTGLDTESIHDNYGAYDGAFKDYGGPALENSPGSFSGFVACSGFEIRLNSPTRTMILTKVSSAAAYCVALLLLLIVL